MIETTILNISKTRRMSSGENLLGFQIDCEHLIQQEYFIGTEVSVGLTHSI